MERQLLIAQLSVLLEHRTAQHASAGRPWRPVSLTPRWAKVRRDHAEQLTTLVQPPRHRLLSTTDCSANRSNMLARTVRSWRIVGSGGAVVLWNQWFDAKVYPKPPETAPPCRIPSTISAH